MACHGERPAPSGLPHPQPPTTAAAAGRTSAARVRMPQGRMPRIMPRMPRMPRMSGGYDAPMCMRTCHFQAHQFFCSLFAGRQTESRDGPQHYAYAPGGQDLAPRGGESAGASRLPATPAGYQGPPASRACRLPAGPPGYQRGLPATGTPTQISTQTQHSQTAHSRISRSSCLPCTAGRSKGEGGFLG